MRVNLKIRHYPVLTRLRQPAPDASMLADKRDGVADGETMDRGDAARFAPGTNGCNEAVHDLYRAIGARHRGAGWGRAAHAPDATAGPGPSHG